MESERLRQPVGFSVSVGEMLLENTVVVVVVVFSFPTFISLT